MEIILRSASPRRKELLEKANYKFDINVADIDETMDDNLTPYENVKRLGLLKAAVNQEEYYGNILIGCDTIVVYNAQEPYREIIEKEWSFAAILKK